MDSPNDQTQNHINQIIGHLIDIDSDGKLRIRLSHKLCWDASGKLTYLSPATSSEIESLSPGTRLPVIMPGAIDCHVHYPQTNIIGGSGKDLLDWLDKNVWPEEQRLASREYADATAATFLKQLVKHGTTSALVFGSQFVEATDILFSRAQALGMCMITGLTLQDRNTIPVLEFGPEESKESSEAMISRWHGVDRLRYAVTPRFSPACSPDLLGVCRELLDAHEDLYFQTHINESASEIVFVSELFPDCEDYLATYEQHNLVRQRSVLAHSVHPNDSELSRMGEADCSVAHCPSSNGFLGSGAFPYQKHLAHGIRVGVGTDVGAGVSFSLWNEMRHAHLMQMRLPFDERHAMTGETMLKAITVDSARALHLQDEVGNFESGKWADFIVVSEKPGDTSAFAATEDTEVCGEQLFRFAIQGEAGRIAETYIAGRLVYARDKAE